MKVRLATRWLTALLLISGTAFATPPALPPADSVQAVIRKHLDADDAFSALGTPLAPSKELRAFYERRDFRIAWFDENGVKPVANELVETLAEAESHGLRANDYRQRLLSDQLATLNDLMAISPQYLAELDLTLSWAFLGYGDHLLRGRVKPASVDKDWLIDTRDRDLAAFMEAAISAGRVAAPLNSLAPVHQEYATLRAGLAEYRAKAAAGGWPTISAGPKLQLGSRGTRVQEVRARLLAEGDLKPTNADNGLIAVSNTDAPPAVEVSDPEVFDTTLEAAVKTFQRRHTLDDDGVVGPRTLAAMNVTVQERLTIIQANLERWRWLPDHFGQRYIRVDIAGFTMAVVEEGEEVFGSKIVVGMAERQTPVFTADMSYVVFSPYWNVPRSIAVKDKLPQLREDAYKLFRQNIRIFDRNGVEVDPGMVDWSQYGRNNFPFRMRQDPGDNNALGKVKFMLPNSHAIYLHDTSSRQLFDRVERSYSSGCIRVQNPIELAEYLLRDSERWDREAIMSAYNGRRERTVNLQRKVPVYLLYWTARADADGRVQFRSDIYNRDPALLSAFSTQ